jgi:ubiquinone/menaquinone biosynthesis C-methylase UbiE
MNKFFYEVFENIPRQGPGMNKSTEQAYKHIEPFLSGNPQILDIGCGKGVQTLELLRLSEGKIIACDNHPFFLECLKSEASKAGFQNRISTLQADMADLPCKENSFDLIWAEGSVFVIGIRNGLKKWKKFLKKGGFLVLTDLVWLRDDRPDELTRYWEKECLSVLTVDQVIESAKQEGYNLLTYFNLPEKGWLEEYILPQERVIKLLRKKYSEIQEAEDTFRSIENENEIVKKYLGYFGYVFFIWKQE